MDIFFFPFSFPQIGEQITFLFWLGSESFGAALSRCRERRVLRMLAPPSWICKCRDNSLPLWQASLTEALGFSWAACWQACLAVGGWLFSCTGWAVGVRTERLRQLNVLLFNPGCNNNTETCGILSSNCQALVPKMKYVCKEVALLSEVLSTSSSWSFSGLVRAQGCKNQEAKKSGSKHRPRNRAQLLDLLF